MNVFNLNYKELNDSIMNYKKYKKLLTKNIEDNFSILNNIDAAWYDINSVQFMKMLKIHKFKVINYFDDMDSLFKKMECFQKDIKEISLRYFSKSNFSRINYDDSKVNICLNKLNKINMYLKNALKYIEMCDFEDVSLVNEFQSLKQMINDMIIEVNKVIVKLNSLNKSINDIVYKYSSSIKKIYKSSLDINPIIYKSNIKISELKD